VISPLANKKLLIGIAVLSLLSAVFLLARSRFRHTRALSGQQSIAPDFVLPGINGGAVQLSAYRGRVVLLDFWATWCEPCREETPQFVELQDKYRDQGLQILGVSMDDNAEPVREFYKQFKVNYPVVMGNARIGELYGGVLGLPIAFLIRRDGRVYVRHDGATNITTLEAEIKSALATKT
jgi:thiol-disulfide isomerase/thioredoxin